MVVKLECGFLVNGFGKNRYRIFYFGVGRHFYLPFACFAVGCYKVGALLFYLFEKRFAYQLGVVIVFLFESVGRNSLN